MSDFFYQEPFPLTKDDTKYRLITKDYVSVVEFEGRKILKIDPNGLELLAEEAMTDVSFFLRKSHLEQLSMILDDPEATDNDKFVAYSLLKNSVTAADGELPTCQDTGTAIVMGKKGEDVYTGVNDAEFFSKGIYNTYEKQNLRFSQIVPLTMLEEKNSGTNLPAQIDLYSIQGNEYKFLFVAKGGGSANKTYLYQQTKQLLTEDNLKKFLNEKLREIGTAACPPYHLAFVIGGASAEKNLQTVKYASAGYLDNLPTTGNEGGRAFRDLEWEAKVLKMTQDLGIGAQYGGKYFAHDIRVIRLSRHAASNPVGMGVSCSADRNIKAKITPEGIFVEQMEKDPKRLMPEAAPHLKPAVEIDIDQPMEKILEELSKHPIKTRLSLTGTLIVARDMAHARIQEMLDNGEEMPEYFKDHPVYYAGPAKTPKGMPSGSFGPTTSNRMDPYVDGFQAKGGSMIMLAKGNRTPQVKESCQKYGGFYLGSIGGPAALLAKENILSIEVVAFPEYGMEAVRKIKVKNFPAFIVTDDKGNDFFEQI
ncbi:MAG: fumarate hydratase [Bacteroidetes bacterium]|nr:MAG: fumarate hydratase [Bacteroidota bacterium]